MVTFSSRNTSVAVVPAGRERIWAVLRDADSLAALTPLVQSIDVSEDVWVWHLRGISAVGVSVTPSFTELMSFDAPNQIRFAHQPPNGRNERAGAGGTYGLERIDDGHTRLSIDITLCVELPLPSLSRRVVEATIASMMQRMGDRFATNLYERLSIDPASIPPPAILSPGR